MSDPRLISPLLDGFALGDSISYHCGVRCYPAMRNDSDERYIVKTVSIPASQVQLEALLLTGAYPDEESAKGYFKELAKDIRDEVEILDKLSAQRGFLPYTKYQIVPMEEGVGYEVFLLSPYKQSLERQLKSKPLTHLAAVNMGIDMCAALSVCREAGYLYADLKPGNIFKNGEQEYRISDLGFLPLNSLKYASLPDRYRSDYVPPEISDAYATLNTTMDTYALGLILYQVFNNGQLPFDSEESRKALMAQLENGEPIPPPAYADYEMAEIILKACAFKPEDRWISPKEMGHALIAYMQRNAVNDVPIIPPPVEPPVVDPPEEASPEADTEISSDASADEADAATAEAEGDEQTADSETPDNDEEDSEQPEEGEGPDSGQSEDAQPSDSEEPEETEEADWIDRMGNILAEDESASSDGADPDEPSLRELLETDEDNSEELSAEELTGEAAEILNQAQELIDHETPEPAVAPEPIEIPMPAPIVLEDDDDEDNADAPAEEPLISDDVSDEPSEDAPAETPEEVPVEKPKRNYKKLILSAVAAIILAAVLYGGYYAVTHIYLVPIDSFTVAGKDDVLTVSIGTPRDESLITVICKDNFGNVERASVENGQAVFTALTPGNQYLVTLEANGHHKLIGEIGQRSYSTPTRTQVASFAATAGPEDGSAVINFAVEGPDSKDWTLHYSAEGEEEKTFSFSGHTATVTGLTLGKSYDFRLSASDDVFLIGENSIKFFSGELVFAEKISVFTSEDGTMTTSWNAPKDSTVENWTVHCYNENGYDQTQEVTDSTAVFTDISADDAYILEITAKGMSESVVVDITPNPINIIKIKAESSGASIHVSWDFQGVAPENGWLVTCTADNGIVTQTATSSTTEATVSPVAPGTHYDVSIQTVDGTSVFGKTATADTSAITDTFSGYRLDASDFSISMYHGPEGESWGRGDLGESTTTFAPGSKMALEYYTGKIYDLSDDKLESMFIIRNAQGKLVSMTSRTRTWDDMIDRGYCLEEIAELPTEAGSYTLEIYVKSAKFADLSFTIE